MAHTDHRYGFDSPKSRLWPKLLSGLLLLVALVTGVFFAGPRNEFGTNAPTQRPLPPKSIAALDDWIKNSEAAFPDIKPGNAKGIVWNSPDKKRTPWAVVYIHGWSASRLETAPVAELVAKELGANTFYTRLSGHGRSGAAALGEATPQDWMADTVEAVQIGQTLGERVLLISCSTGSTLATWFATSAEGRQVAADVFISPNFGPKDKRGEIINGPWGKKIAFALQGETRGWTPENDREANAWTTHHPTQALFPMMALVKAVRDSDLSTFQTPLLVLYSEKDRVVDPVETLSAFARIGSPMKTVETVTYSQNKDQHVLAGAIKGPEAVTPMVDSIVTWAKALPKDKS